MSIQVQQDSTGICPGIAASAKFLMKIMIVAFILHPDVLVKIISFSGVLVEVVLHDSFED